MKQLILSATITLHPSTPDEEMAFLQKILTEGLDSLLIDGCDFAPEEFTGSVTIKDNDKRRVFMQN